MCKIAPIYFGYDQNFRRLLLSDYMTTLESASNLQRSNKICKYIFFIQAVNMRVFLTVAFIMEEKDYDIIATDEGVISWLVVVWN